MDYKQAFVYVFEDKDWVGKIVIGALLGVASVFIVPAIFLSGYYIRVIREVMKGKLSGLPEWNGWGKLFITGLNYWIVCFIYALPFILLGFLLFFTTFFPTFLSGVIGEERLIALVSPLTLFGQIFWQVFIIIVPLLFAFWFPAVAIRFAETDDIKACFDFRLLWEFIRKNFGDYLVVVLLIWALGYVASAGIIFFCIGVFFTSFYVQLVCAHLKGQLYRQQFKDF